MAICECSVAIRRFQGGVYTGDKSDAEDSGSGVDEGTESDWWCAEGERRQWWEGGKESCAEYVGAEGSG